MELLSSDDLATRKAVVEVLANRWLWYSSLQWVKVDHAKDDGLGMDRGGCLCCEGV